MRKVVISAMTCSHMTPPPLYDIYAATSRYRFSAGRSISHLFGYRSTGPKAQSRMTSLLQTAINNLSLQSGHSPSKPAAKRLPSDRGRKRASNPNPESSDEGDFGFSFNGGDDSDDDEEDGDEVVELITRPSTPSPGARGGFGSGSGGLKESGGGSGSVGRESSVGKTQITARDPVRTLSLEIGKQLECDRLG